MKLTRNNQGFTLIEVIIAVALVAIMAVAIAPPLIQNIRDGKSARAQSDVRAIGTAVLSFYKDVGQWPVAVTTSDVDRLVGNERLGGGDAGIAAGNAGVTGSDGWATEGNPSSLTAHLIKNKSAAADTIWPFSGNPVASPGWNGPYLLQETLDPWGKPYVVNIRYGMPVVTGSTTEDYNRHNVMVLSSGPNKLFETPMRDTAHDEAIGGDDIGYIFNRANRF
jgi:prepilin-type N-terminal cleavage/methylation domain-containing protein